MWDGKASELSQIEAYLNSLSSSKTPTKLPGK